LLAKAKAKAREWGGKEAGAYAGYSWGKIRIKSPSAAKAVVISSEEDLLRIKN